MVPEQLQREVAALKESGAAIDLVEAEGVACVVLHDRKLPVGYNKRSTELLLKLPLSYPNGQPDMFWTDCDLTLANSGIPRSAEAIEPALGKQWRRFSWHPARWNPGTDDLSTYLEFVDNRLVKIL